MFDIIEYLKERQIIVDSEIAGILEKLDNGSKLFKAVRYSLTAPSKRIRPILFMAAAEAVGGNFADIIDFACAIEMIHTYSLIHDDLPGMDNDEIRRGKPTLHIKFNETTAILAGDALLTLAFQILLGPVSGKFSEYRLKAMKMLADAAGYANMIEGQMQDMESENRVLTIKEITRMHKLKTGALIKASVCAGAVMAKASFRQLEILETYAHNIGLAFQVADDILNVKGAPEVLGKNVGTDAQRSKNTFVSILGINQAQKYAENLIKEAAGIINNTIFKPDKTEPLISLSEYIIKRQK